MTEQERLQLPPTEQEIACLLNNVRHVSYLEMVVRRLAFERDRLKDENDRLREALDSIGKHPNAEFNVAACPYEMPTIKQIANEALEEQL